ncbi:MAG: FumA C-terminus/TtdB family hydratase beta subunit [Anaerotardibacter sp.]
MNSKKISLPLSRIDARSLKAGDLCYLTGTLFVLRDAGHMRLLEEIGHDQSLPYGLSGQIIFYAGPTPAAAGRPFGSIGPTTSSRMDFAAPKLYEMGIVGTIGKGYRSEEVRNACVEYSSVYFVAPGGAAALLAKCVTSAEVVAYDDLGTEALRKITVKDFPVFVGIDTSGDDIYDIVR